MNAPPTKPSKSAEPEAGTAEAQLKLLAHLIPDDGSLFDRHERRSFFNSILLHCAKSGYAPDTFQIVRAKGKDPVQKPKEEPKDAWYAALIALDPGQELGFKRLITGPAFTGPEGAARKQAIRGLRDQLEEMTHGLLVRAGKAPHFHSEVHQPGETKFSSRGGSGGGIVSVVKDLL